MSTQKTPRMITFNHYTSRKGLRAILKSGVIQESKIRQNDATFGDGVYGTTIPPDKGRRKIATNNWGRYWKQHAFLGKIDRVIQIKLPNTRIWKAKSCRNILIHKGPIFLKRYKWQVRKVPVLDEEEDSDEDSEDEEEEETDSEELEEDEEEADTEELEEDEEEADSEELEEDEEEADSEELEEDEEEADSEELEEDEEEADSEELEEDEEEADSEELEEDEEEADSEELEEDEEEADSEELEEDEEEADDESEENEWD